MFDIQVCCRLTYGKFSYFVTDWYAIAGDDHDTVKKHIEKRWRIVKAREDVTIDHVRIVRAKERK